MRSGLRILCLCVVVAFLQACSHASIKTEAAAPTPVAPPASKIAESAPVESEDAEIDEVIAESNPVMDGVDGSVGAPLKVPAEINERVAYWVDFFTVRERERTIRFLERGLPLQANIEKILKENDMPVELFYLAMIESGFVQSAKSRAKAVGVWQFMSGTGKNYGLMVNGVQDERRNWIKSTEAAASYLKDLNNVFGSWYLALAAYNAGEGRIIRSIMRGKTRDFWALAEAGLLPKETLNYVPKFLAAIIVGKNLKKYGLDVRPEEAWDEYASVSVPAGVSLDAVARTTNIPLAEIQRWNRDLIKGVTPYNRSGSVDIYLPKQYGKRIADASDALKKLHPISLAKLGVKADSARSRYASYVVRGGDSLSSIARDLGVSRRTLMKMNGLRHSQIHVGQRLKYNGNSRPTAERKIASTNLPRHHHRVRKGDNLNTIAKRYKMSVQDLVRMNALKGNNLHVGQRLVVL